MPNTARKTRNAKEVAEIVEQVAHLLGRGAHKFQVKRWLRERLRCSPRACEPYISRARELLREAVGRDKKELVVESYAFYVSIVRDANATTRERMLAQMALDSLLGLRTPVPPRHREKHAKQWNTPIIERIREEARDVLAGGGEGG